MGVVGKELMYIIEAVVKSSIEQRRMTIKMRLAVDIRDDQMSRLGAKTRSLSITHEKRK